MSDREKDRDREEQERKERINEERERERREQERKPWTKEEGGYRHPTDWDNPVPPPKKNEN